MCGCMLVHMRRGWVSHVERETKMGAGEKQTQIVTRTHVGATVLLRIFDSSFSLLCDTRTSAFSAFVSFGKRTCLCVCVCACAGVYIEARAAHVDGASRLS